MTYTNITHVENQERGETVVVIDGDEIDKQRISQDQYESLVGSINYYEERAKAFNEKHGTTSEQQFKCLVEELGELSEDLLKENRGGIEEELADIVFIAYTLANLHGINLDWNLQDTFKENLAKNTDKNGDKVTKE